MDQPKIERMLRMLQFLIDNIENNRRSLGEISQKLDLSERSIYRYLDTFKEAGFRIIKENEFYSLDRSDPKLRALTELIYFTEEEAYILKQTIESLNDSQNEIFQSLKRKLYSVYNFKKLAEISVDKSKITVVNRIGDAISEKRQVLFKNYHSSNSGSVEDRLVEPFKYGTNMVDITCFEPSSGMNKIFKISRIAEVEILDSNWQFESNHKEYISDIFRLRGFNQYAIKLKMTMRAMNLLKEEFPMSKEYIIEDSHESYILECNVTSYEGPARFVLGLCNEIQILDSIDFKAFISNKLKKSRILT